MIKILALGDVVGDSGTKYLAQKRRLASYVAENKITMVIANGENSAEGNGILPSSATELFDAGVDVITGGNHSWQRREIYDYLDEHENILRPANYPDVAAGHGWTLFDLGSCVVLVVNLVGLAFMDSVANPFDTVDEILKENNGRYDFAVIDLHAETTSEKKAMGWYLDGLEGCRVAAFFGTHTHVQTSDATVLPGGMGYITDIGMCGSENGVLGVDKDIIIKRFRDRMPSRNFSCRGAEAAHGAVFEIDEKTGRCLSCTAVEF